MYVTIVVCTRDRPQLLSRCLQSLLPQLTNQDELIIVDNASTTSKTQSIVSETSSRYIYLARPGLNVARNAAVKAAQGDVVAFIDDDAVVSEGWLIALRLAFADVSVACVTGRTLPLSLETAVQRHFEFRFSFDRGEHLQRFTGDDVRPWFPIYPYHLGAGCNMAFRRDVFDKIGVFDEALDAGTRSGGGGDLDIFRRVLLAGFVVVYAPDALAFHEHRKEANPNRQQFWNYGKTFGVLMVKIFLIEPSLRWQVPRLVWQHLNFLLKLGWGRLRRQHELPLRLIILEFLGNLAGPSAYLLALRQARIQRETHILSAMPDRDDLNDGELTLSLIVCTRDRPQKLRRCLASVAQMYDSPDELIVVDNGRNSPKTELIAAEYGARFIREPLLGLCRARNRGLSVARGDIVAFIDDDVIVDRGWLAALIKPYRRAAIQAVLGLVIAYSQETAAQRIFEQEFGGLGRGRERKRYQGEVDLPSVPQMGVGANMSYRRQALLDIGGFNEALDPGMPTQAGGDIDAFYRLLRAGGAIIYEPTACISHEHRREICQLKALLRAYGSGTAAAYVSWSLRGDWRAVRMGVALYLRYFPSRLRSSWSSRNRESSAFYWEEFKGALAGPFLYWQSCRRIRHYPKIISQKQPQREVLAAIRK